MKNLTNDEMEKGAKGREYDCQRKFLLKKGLKVIEMRDYDYLKLVKNNVDGAGSQMKSTYHYQKAIKENKVIEDIKGGLKFSVVDWPVQVPGQLRKKR